MSSASQPETAKPIRARRPGEKPRSVTPCDFHSAGRLSNESARALTALHETFARYLAVGLDAYLGAGLEVKLQGLDQLPLKDHMASIPQHTYIVPFTLASVPSTMIAECDIDLVFPIIELLLGGTGTSVNRARDLSEIEEEIMRTMMSVVARQAENAWQMETMDLTPERRIKPSILPQHCPASEKVTIVKFEMEVVGTTGTFQLVFPTSFLNVLIKLIKMDEPKKKSRLRHFPAHSIRERILDCDFIVAAGLTQMKVAVRDLVALQPGSVLKLRAPVRTPGMLTVGEMEIFESVPVRNGTQKAAQLGRRVRPASWRRE